MEQETIDGFSFIRYKLPYAEAVFSTASFNNNFNINSTAGLKNINKIKTIFKLEEISYNKQIHSSIITYQKSSAREGDAIITSSKNIGIGIFTADCVPVLMCEKEKGVIAAVHSGWKGTYNKICTSTIDELRKTYNINLDKLQVFIGPHIKECCYEISKELEEKFNIKYVEDRVANNRYLNLEKCIKSDIMVSGIKEENIFNVNLCTKCSTNPKFYSYRNGDTDKRMFSFIFLK